MRLALIGTCASAILLGAPRARAANGSKPPVPPVFVDGQCLITVDRSVDPVVELPVAIPFEDDLLTADEPPDSRTLQFFAMCRDHPPTESLPAWVEVADAEAALELGLIDTLPEPQDVLQTASTWSEPDCVAAIVGVDERMPITCDSTGGGFVWDTHGVAPGTYRIRGYTYEPPSNLWTPRDGLVHVTDGGDEDPEPAVALVSPYGAARVPAGAGLTLRGCAVGPNDLEVTIAWAALADLQQDEASAWVEIESVDVVDGSFTTLVRPPDEALYEAVFFRAEVRAPDGRTGYGYTHREAVFVPGCEWEETMPAYPDACGVAPTAPPVDPTSCTDDPEDTDDDEPPAGAAGGEGCRVVGTSDPGRPLAVALGLLLPLALVGRRR